MASLLLRGVGAGKRRQMMNMGGKPDAAKTDPLADKAEALLGKAESLSPKNSEIYVVKKMIATTRMMADPMTRYMKYGPMAEEALQMAIKLNRKTPVFICCKGRINFIRRNNLAEVKKKPKSCFKYPIKSSTPLSRPLH